MRASVRCAALDMSALEKAEQHGKRLDHSSQRRVIRDVSPLVAEGLDLRALYDEHVDGVKQNAAAKKPVLHFIVRFPPELLDEAADIGRFTGSKDDRQLEMMRQAVTYIDRTHGGQAVFAARVDRDELGETIVDVFAAPKYEKRTKRTKPDEPGVMWASSTKYGRELAEKHQEEIRRRHPKAKGKLTGPRHVGIALQSEFAEFFARMNGVKLTPKREKNDPRNDRIEREAWQKIENERADLEADRLRISAQKSQNDEISEKNDAETRSLVELKAKIRVDHQELDERRATIDAERVKLDDDRAALDKAREELEAEKSVIAGLRDRLIKMIRRVERWLDRPDLSAPAAAAAAPILDDAVHMASAIEDPTDETPSPDL